MIVNIRKVVKFEPMGTPFSKLKDIATKNFKQVFQVMASDYT